MANKVDLASTMYIYIMGYSQYISLTI